MNTIQASYCANILKVSFVLIVLLPTMVLSECTNTVEESEKQKKEALKYKLAALATILVAGALGVSLPLLSRKIPQLSPENDMFFMIKAFAAGVILATGFIHILPNGFHNLTSPCLKQNPWGKFPFSGFVAMMSSILTLTVDSFATGFYKRLVANNKSKGVKEDEEEGHDQSNHTAVPKHSTVGHAHGSDLPEEDLSTSELIRMRIISQVLELGVVVHSVIIGMSLGVSKNPETIKPLLVALSFHQFFEGLGLGGSICQAKFKSRSMAIMATFFSLTTPVGIAIGISISRVYQASSPAALIVEGTLESASAGILIYMALVDLLAEDFMNPRLQTNLRLQLGSYVSLLLGTGCMSLLAYWV